MAVLSWASSLGSLYASWLERRPIVTKSVTASLIFGLSDYLAQVLERSAKPTTTATPTTTISSKRILWSMLVGLLYFGPAAHFWYGTIFRLLPGTSLWSTLQKAALGQLIFGPSFTCIFFATALIQSGQWSFNAWFRKIAQDLPKAWLAGAGFWPLMDLISYSYISREWIPLFINCCSLVWTIYLSLIANKRR
jgi:protein Mpv17